MHRTRQNSSLRKYPGIQLPSCPGAQVPCMQSPTVRACGWGVCEGSPLSRSAPELSPHPASSAFSPLPLFLTLRDGQERSTACSAETPPSPEPRNPQSEGRASVFLPIAGLSIQGHSRSLACRQCSAEWAASAPQISGVVHARDLSVSVSWHFGAAQIPMQTGEGSPRLPDTRDGAADWPILTK